MQLIIKYYSKLNSSVHFPSPKKQPKTPQLQHVNNQTPKTPPTYKLAFQTRPNSQYGTPYIIIPFGRSFGCFVGDFINAISERFTSQ